MLSAQISFKDKLIILIGGGHQAWRIGQKFIAQGANVQFYALTFLDEIPRDMRKEIAYHTTILHGAFLVYACCDDSTLNRQIVEDANALNIMSASIQKDKYATFHSVREKDLPHLHVSVSTKGASPVFGDVILQDIEKLYTTRYHSVLSQLQYIRQYVLSKCDDIKQRSTFLKYIAKEDPRFITYIYDCIHKQDAKILCFHGNEDDVTLQLLHRFVNEFQEPLYFAYLKEGKKVRSIKTIKQIMDFLSIPTTYYVVTLEEGRIYHKIVEQLKGEHIVSCILDENDIINIINHYQDHVNTLFVVHESKYSMVFTTIQQHANANTSVMKLHDEIDVGNKDEVYVVPLLLLKGKHFYEDIESLQGLQGSLLKYYSHVEIENQCLMESEIYRAILKKHIGIHE